jgi:hypothetical protein
MWDTNNRAGDGCPQLNSNWPDSLTNYITYLHDAGLTQVRIYQCPATYTEVGSDGVLGYEPQFAEMLVGAGADWLQYDYNVGIAGITNGPLGVHHIQYMSRLLDDACARQHRPWVAMRIILNGDLYLPDGQTNAAMPTGPWMNEAVNSWCGLHDLYENDWQGSWYRQVHNLQLMMRTRQYIGPYHFPDAEALGTTFGGNYTEANLSYEINTNAVRANYIWAVMLPADIRYAGYTGMGNMQNAFSNTVWNPVMRKIHKDSFVYPMTLDWQTADELGWQVSRVVPDVCDGVAVAFLNLSTNISETFTCSFTNVPGLKGFTNVLGILDIYANTNFIATNSFTFADVPGMSARAFLVSNIVTGYQLPSNVITNDSTVPFRMSGLYTNQGAGFINLSNYNGGAEEVWFLRMTNNTANGGQVVIGHIPNVNYGGYIGGAGVIATVNAALMFAPTRTVVNVGSSSSDAAMFFKFFDSAKAAMWGDGSFVLGSNVRSAVANEDGSMYLGNNAYIVGAVNATNGFRVAAAIGLTTNINVLLEDSTTNQLQFSKGILTGVVPLPIE